MKNMQYCIAYFSCSVPFLYLTHPNETTCLKALDTRASEVNRCFGKYQVGVGFFHCCIVLNRVHHVVTVLHMFETMCRFAQSLSS